MTRVVVLTGDPLGDRLAGPGIRATAIAAELARGGHEVRLVTTGGVSTGSTRGSDSRVSTGSTRGKDPREEPVETHAVRPGDNRSMRAHERWADVILFQGYALGQFACLTDTDRVLVADLYAPFHLELAEQGRAVGAAEPAATTALRVEIAERAILDQLGRADLVLAANDRQRQLYRAMLAGVGRPAPDELFRLVPFGLDAEPPSPASAPVIRGVFPGTDSGDTLVVWGGGVYDWFDPLTLIRAVGELRDRVPRLRLLFLGTKNPRVGEPGMVGRAVALADELGLTGRHVFFNTDWVPYAERGGWLLEADAGVSTHPVHEETRYAFRTRILDYLWAGLPMVVTEGDGFADLVAERGLGVVVPEGDVAALADALELVADAAAAARFRSAVPAVAAEFAWPRALALLTAFVERPAHAADYRPGRAGMSALGPVPVSYTHLTLPTKRIV